MHRRGEGFQLLNAVVGIRRSRDKSVGRWIYRGIISAVEIRHRYGIQCPILRRWINFVLSEEVWNLRRHPPIVSEADRRPRLLLHWIWNPCGFVNAIYFGFLGSKNKTKNEGTKNCLFPKCANICIFCFLSGLPFFDRRVSFDGSIRTGSCYFLFKKCSNLPPVGIGVIVGDFFERHKKYVSFKSDFDLGPSRSSKRKHLLPPPSLIGGCSLRVRKQFMQISESQPADNRLQISRIFSPF